MRKFTIKSSVREIHLWLGLTSGLIVFVVAITGAIYVFSEDIKYFTHQDRRIIEVPIHTEKLPISKLLNIAEGVFNNEYTPQNIVIPNFSNQTVRFIFQQTNKEAFGYTNYVKFHKTVYINPYNAKIVKIENSKWEFFSIVLSIHMNLFLGHNLISSVIIQTSVWIFVFMLLSGLILWWPKKKNQRKISLSFKWKETTRWKRKNYDLHKILGFYFVLLALISALTGLLWASKSFDKTVKWVANGGEVIQRELLPKPKLKAKSLSPVDDIYNHAQSQNPETRYFLIRKHPNIKVPYMVRSYIDEVVNFTRIEMFYDRDTAELLSKKTFADKNNGDKVQAINYDLHVGSIGGWPTKILTFIMSLVIASLPITGFLIWLGKKKKK
jgi:uncharacterized iron-regulated membrane protein